MDEGFDWDADALRNGIFEPTIRDLVLKQIQLEHNALEEMVERMLVSPVRCGVVVVLNEIIDLDNLEASSTRHYRLDPNVPFGHIYEFPSMKAYELWQERGHPPLV